MKKIIVVAFALLLSVLDLSADRRAIISLITCEPGQEIYELEGHSGLRILIPGETDMVANWGVFDFNTPNFAYRFTKGETDYMMAFEPTSNFLNRYYHNGRSVKEQVLALSDEETEAIIHMMQVNALPENRTYRYNYIKDNCATRPLELISIAIEDTLTFCEKPKFDSFRDAMKFYHMNYPWYQFGIDLALGGDIDKGITIREETFAPVRLYEIIATATRNNGEPIVTECRTLVNFDKSPVLSPTPFYLSPIFFSFIILAVTTIICYLSFHKKKIIKSWNFILFFLFGILGLVLTFLIFISEHEATGRNFLYLWLNPLVLLISLTILIKRLEKLSYWLQIINFALVFSLLIVAILSLQKLNPAFYPLIISDLMCSITFIYIYRWQKKHHR